MSRDVKIGIIYVICMCIAVNNSLFPNWLVGFALAGSWFCITARREE